MNENLPAINLSDAVAKIKGTPEGDAVLNHLNDIINKNVVAIGTDNAFALTDQDGQIKAFKMNLELSVNEGTLVSIGNYNGAPITISAQGYEKWAEKTGASVIFPKDVLVGGSLMPNPYAERDPENNRILAVHARAVAFKYSAMGLPQVCDWTTIFDVPSYRMIDLLAKAKKTPQAFKLLPNEMEPPATNNETWAKYPFDEATSLWLNTSHKEVLDWFKSIINREKKSMDFAQTFARRNALKHLSGLQKPPQGMQQWSLPVIAWRPTGNNIVKWDASQYSELQDRVSGMIEGNNEFDQGEVKQLEVRKGVEKISEELDNQEIIDDVNPDDPAEKPSNDVKKPEQTEEPAHVQNHVEPETGPGKVELSNAQKQLAGAAGAFPEDYQTACFNCKMNVTDWTKMSDDECKKVFKELNSIIDGGNQ